MEITEDFKTKNFESPKKHVEGNYNPEKTDVDDNEATRQANYLKAIQIIEDFRKGFPEGINQFIKEEYDPIKNYIKPLFTLTASEFEEAYYNGVAVLLKQINGRGIHLSKMATNDNPLKLYLIAIIRNNLHESYRIKNKDNKFKYEVSKTSSISDEPAWSVGMKELKIILECANQLTRKEKKKLKDFYYRKLTLKQIAQEDGVKYETAKVAKSNALAKLIALVSKRLKELE